MMKNNMQTLGNIEQIVALCDPKDEESVKKTKEFLDERIDEMYKAQGEIEGYIEQDQKALGMLVEGIDKKSGFHLDDQLYLFELKIKDLRKHAAILRKVEVQRNELGKITIEWMQRVNNSK